jgi:hypothetical protein
MFRIYLIVVALLIGGVHSVQGQDRGRPGGDSDPGAVLFLLGMRGELDLTSRQVTKLERINTDLDRLNLPLMARMTEIRRKFRELGSFEESRGERRQEFESHIGEARAVMERIQANNWTAMRQVGDVLTEQQKERLAKLLRERDDNQGERRGGDSRVPSHRN